MSDDHSEPGFRFAVRVRYADTDQMGMAYHGNYVTWFEVGRTEMLRAQGTSYREVEEAGFRMGLLDYRPQHMGPFGTFEVVKFEVP